MLVALAGITLNVVLDPLLILGVGPFPRLGVTGAGLATVAGETASLALALGLAATGRFPLRLAQARASFSAFRAGQIFRIGAPEAVIDFLFSAVYMVLAYVTGKFGAPATAALGIVNRLESVTYLTAAAIGLAVATMVGQNLGARLPDRAAASARTGGILITGVAGLLTVVYLALPEAIVRLFTDDAEVTRQAVLFLRIVAISQVFMGWELVYGQAFVGAGNTVPPMVISSLTSVARIPMAWGLAFHTSMGTDGIWWTISITGIVRGLLLVFWFRRGRWKERDLKLDPLPPAAAPPAGTEAAVPLGPEGPAG
jgi:putative MATE family efflux protein